MTDRPNCSSAGQRHVYRGGLTCLICGARHQRRNELGTGCIKCGTVLTEKNSTRKGNKLQCRRCSAERMSRSRSNRRARHK